MNAPNECCLLLFPTQSHSLLAHICTARPLRLLVSFQQHNQRKLFTADGIEREEMGARETTATKGRVRMARLEMGKLVVPLQNGFCVPFTVAMRESLIFQLADLSGIFCISRRANKPKIVSISFLFSNIFSANF